MKKYDQIHETVLKTVFDLYDEINDIADRGDLDFLNRHRNTANLRSIARASNDLICVFPVLSSRNISIDAQSMISKAIEKNCVSMLQILFSAYQLTDSKDAIDYISTFHTNINKSAKLFDVDDLIDIADAIEEGAIRAGMPIDGGTLHAIKEDMRRLDYYLPDNVSPKSLEESFSYKLDPKGNFKVDIAIKRPKRMVTEEGYDDFDDTSAWFKNHQSGEASPDNSTDMKLTLALLANRDLYNNVDSLRKGNAAKDKTIKNQRKTIENQGKTIADQNKEISRYKSQAASTGKIAHSEIEKNKKLQDQLNKQQAQIDRITGDDARLERNSKMARMAKDRADASKAAVEIYNKQVLNTEYKKANELQPTLMVVNFQSKVDDGYVCVDSVVIGVKAKLYPVNSEDMITHIVSKAKDLNWVQKLIKASTREISFFRDFLFAIDKAKIDALSLSRKGSSNKMWKVLERRANKSRFNRLLARKNDSTAITTVMVSQNEVDFMNKQYGVDIADISIARGLLDKYNLLGICIVDESLEIAKFMWDTGEDMWETISFTNLERESNDNTYKKVVNLMTKVM